MENKTKKKSSGSVAGYHFWSQYSACQRSFYLRFICGLVPKETSPAFAYGIAIHAGVAAFYRADEDPKQAFDNALETQGDLYDEQRAKGHHALDTYVIQYQEDFEYLEIYAIEQEILAHLPDGTPVTARIDRIMRNKLLNHYLIYETKTTSFSAGAAHHQVECQDQATNYIWAARKAGIPVQAVVPDIIYQRQSVLKLERFGEIYRTDEEIEDFIEGTMGVRTEINQKTASVTCDNQFRLFPRNPSKCAFGKCPYEPICRLRLDPTYPAPAGFEPAIWEEQDG